jgi:hypothetical protein
MESVAAGSTAFAAGAPSSRARETAGAFLDGGRLPRTECNLTWGALEGTANGSGTAARACTMKPAGDTEPANPLDPARLREIAEELGRSLPAVHGGDRVVLVAVHPRLAYLSWHLDATSVASVRAHLADVAPDARLCLLVRDVTGVEYDGGNAHATFTVPVSETAGREYWPVPTADRTWLAEIGLRRGDGSLAVIARSAARWFDGDGAPDPVAPAGGTSSARVEPATSNPSWVQPRQPAGSGIHGATGTAPGSSPVDVPTGAGVG